MRQLQPIGSGPVAAFLLATAIATQAFAQDEPLLQFGEINPQSSWGSIVGFSADGTQLITRGDDHAVRLWNLKSLQCDMQLDSSYDSDRSTCLSHDGRYLVTPMPTDPRSRKLGLYDLRDGRLLWEKDVGQKAHVSFSPDSQLMTLLDDDNRGFIQLREVDSDIRIGLLHHDLPLQFTPQLSFSPSGRFLAVPGRRKELKVFDLFQGGQPKAVTLPGRNMSMGAAAFIDERSILISSQLFDQGKGTSLLQIWDAASGTMSHELEQFASTSHDSSQVWMCTQHGLYHWQRGNARPSSPPISSTKIGQRNVSNELQSCYPVEAAFDVPSENLFVSFLMSSRMGGDPNYVSCWSTRDSKSVWDKRFDDGDSVPRKLELSPDRRLLAIGLIGKASIASPQVMLVDASSGRELHTCATSKVRGTSLCFSRDGQRIFVGSAAGDITMWDVSPAYLGLGE